MTHNAGWNQRISWGCNETYWGWTNDRTMRWNGANGVQKNWNKPMWWRDACGKPKLKTSRAKKEMQKLQGYLSVWATLINLENPLLILSEVRNSKLPGRRCKISGGSVRLEVSCVSAGRVCRSLTLLKRLAWLSAVLPVHVPEIMGPRLVQRTQWPGGQNSPHHKLHWLDSVRCDSTGHGWYMILHHGTLQSHLFQSS